MAQDLDSGADVATISAHQDVEVNGMPAGDVVESKMAVLEARARQLRAVPVTGRACPHCGRGAVEGVTCKACSMFVQPARGVQAARVRPEVESRPGLPEEPAPPEDDEPTRRGVDAAGEGSDFEVPIATEAQGPELATRIVAHGMLNAPVADAEPATTTPPRLEPPSAAPGPSARPTIRKDAPVPTPDARKVVPAADADDLTLQVRSRRRLYEIRNELTRILDVLRALDSGSLQPDEIPDHALSERTSRWLARSGIEDLRSGLRTRAERLSEEVRSLRAKKTETLEGPFQRSGGAGGVTPEPIQREVLARDRPEPERPRRGELPGLPELPPLEPMDAPPVPAAIRPVGRDVVPSPGALICVHGGVLGHVIRLRGREHTVGRSPDSDVVLDSSTVSRTHARLEWRQGHRFLVDLGSRNGVFIAEERVKDTPIKSGDLVVLGGVGFIYLQHHAIESMVQAELERLDDIDGLTGMPNREWTLRWLGRHGDVESAPPGEHGLARVAVHDIATIHDDYGHLARDWVLRSLARVLRPVIGSEDHLSRVGDAAFALLPADTSVARARALAAGARKAVRNHDFVLNSVDIDVDVRTRVVGTSPEALSLAALI